MSDAKPTDAAPTYEERAADFLKRYGELVKEFNIDIAAYPVYMPDGKGAFITTIQQSTVDTSNQPYRSPFVA